MLFRCVNKGVRVSDLSSDRSSSAFAARRADWRNGPVVYQVFVDRFAPPADPAAFQSYIQPPRRFRQWHELPTPGQYDPSVGHYSHEIEFWGGDLAGVAGRLGYIAGLGADVLYLTPIQAAFTNHRYDTQDYARVAAEIGGEAGLARLIDQTHQHGLRIMLDGVFNHMGRTAAIFQQALQDPNSLYRNWFFFDKADPTAYRGWAGAGNLPALRLEDPLVRAALWGRDEAIVERYLRAGIDGWRLDVAFELGPLFLAELTEAAHRVAPGSAVVGEIPGYPADWFPAVDGVFNTAAPSLMLAMLNGTVAGGRAGRMLGHMVEDAGIAPLLRSWLVVDNHDTPRQTHFVPDASRRRLLQALQFTLPGAPVVYYGSELGMAGAGDPQNRAPMRWDLAHDANPDLAWHRQLITLRRAHPALRYGDCRALETEQLLAFARTTDKIAETVIVVVNPTDMPQTEVFATRIGRLMSWGALQDLLSEERVRSVNGLMHLMVPPRTIRIFTPVVTPKHGYSAYDRIP